MIGDSSAMTAGNQKNEDTPTEGKIGIIDLGAKRSIIKVLEDRDYKVVMIPPFTTSNEILEMIGNPYISDRKNENNMGLGIFIAKNLIENIGGNMRFYNNLENHRSVVEISLKRNQ